MDSQLVCGHITPILNIMGIKGTIPFGLVREYAGTQPIMHPTDKQLIVFTNGADHFICETPTGHERFVDQPVIRTATEAEINHHRAIAEKEHVATPFLW